MSTGRIKISLGVGITLLFCLWGNAQVSVSYYSFYLSKAGIAYHFDEKLWGELRVYGNSILQDFTPELVFVITQLLKKHIELMLAWG
jgi:hypothetical protein